ncbi:MAG: FAD-binding oxidoreductase [Gammaproteobacteria bacterium]|nr:FAD-binding oxidoreductase [Gammaproteobacteria bacterium]
MPRPTERRSFWTWGYVSDEPSAEERAKAAKLVSQRLGREISPPSVPNIEEIKLRVPRLDVPSRLGEFVTSEHSERITHTYGGHSTELLAAIRGHFPSPPDAVAHPRNSDELESVLEWCSTNSICAIPYGGGTSVVWGLNVPEKCDSAVSIDMDCMSGLLEIDQVSRAAKVEAGILGPHLEDALRPHGLTLRHFPQSFPWSTVGGWIATRSGGHYATNHTHIDDFVESVTMLSPQGWFQSRRLPGSGAGPSPDRLILGSEGIFGIISDAWLRLQKRPVYRASLGAMFSDWEKGTEAVRAVVQAKLWPANLRILDPVEAGVNAGLDGTRSLLILGFESADVSQQFSIETAAEIVRDYGGEFEQEDILVADGTGRATGRGGKVGAWRQSFIGVNAGVGLGLGLLSDTFETAITWDQWPSFDAYIRDKVGSVLREVLGESSTLACRFTHVYPDGPAPYYSFSGPVPIGEEFKHWKAIKDAASEAVVDAGGTITHHHAVGRMHKSGWTKQTPLGYDQVLRAIKKEFDPQGVLNPGVLVDP